MIPININNTIAPMRANIHFFLRNLFWYILACLTCEVASLTDTSVLSTDASMESITSPWLYTIVPRSLKIWLISLILFCKDIHYYIDSKN